MAGFFFHHLGGYHEKPVGTDSAGYAQAGTFLIRFVQRDGVEAVRRAGNHTDQKVMSFCLAQNSSRTLFDTGLISMREWKNNNVSGYES